MVTKFFLGIVIALVVIVLAAGAVVGGLIFSAGKAVVQSSGDALKTSSAASKIADFSLPAGYSEDYAVDQLGLTVAAYKPGDGHSHLVLAQGPKGLGSDLTDMLRKAVPGSRNETTRLTVVEKRNATIRGQEVTLVTSDGTNSDGQAYRQVTAAFQGKSGPALLVLEEPLSGWDQAEVDQFIASIH